MLVLKGLATTLKRSIQDRNEICPRPKILESCSKDYSFAVAIALEPSCRPVGGDRKEGRRQIIDINISGS